MSKLFLYGIPFIREFQIFVNSIAEINIVAKVLAIPKIVDRVQQGLVKN
jgi:hypothetical protein